MNKSALKTMIVALVAIGLGATVLSVSCGSTSSTQAPTAGQAADGEALYTQHCVSCHANGAAKVSPSDLTQIESIIKSDKEGMTGFATKLSAAQITAIATYLATLN